MKFFTDSKDVNVVKKMYRKLAMKFHPDRGGKTEDMQDLNAEYHTILKGLHHSEFVGSDEKVRTYYYNENKEQAIMDKLTEVIGLGMVDITIALIGSWIWIIGDTKKYAKLLGKDGIKMRWHGKRKAWFWHLPQGRKTFNRTVTLSQLGEFYGCEEFESKENKKLASA